MVNVGYVTGSKGNRYAISVMRDWLQQPGVNIFGCSCPAWTRNVPRRDCKHIVRFRRVILTQVDDPGVELFVTAAARRAIESVGWTVAGQSPSTTPPTPSTTVAPTQTMTEVLETIANLSNLRRQPYTSGTRAPPPPASRCQRDRCTADRVAGKSFCAAHEPQPRPPPLPPTPKPPAARRCAHDGCAAFVATDQRYCAQHTTRISMIELD